MTNALLKAVCKEAIDLEKAVKAGVAKDFSGLFGALIQAGTDVPAIVSNWGDLQPEFQALLHDPAADADLLAYVAGLVDGETDKAKKIIVASCDLLLSSGQKVVALVEAIKS